MNTHTALRPVNVQEGEGQQSFVPFFGQQLLFELNKVRLQVNHLWSPAIGPINNCEQVTEKHEKVQQKKKEKKTTIKSYLCVQKCIGHISLEF